MRRFERHGSAMLSGLLALAVSGGAGLAASEFAGTWKVKDSSGTPFEIVLSAEGTAEANRGGEGMKGTWTEDGSSAVITWDTGWTTKITKTGDAYTKTAYDKAAATPTNTSPAEKVD